MVLPWSPSPLSSQALVEGVGGGEVRSPAPGEENAGGDAAVGTAHRKRGKEVRTLNRKQPGTWSALMS